MHRRPRDVGRAARLIAIAVCGVLSLTAPATAAASALPPQQEAATVSGTAFGQPIPSGFLGFSFEYKAMHQYTGRNPDAINPVLLSLIRQLNPGQSPVIRIGGDSTDQTWWPIPGEIPPGGVNYGLTPGWMRTTRAFASDLNAKLILGINLEAGRPALAAQEGRALLNGIGAPFIDDLEIGNEPDLYSAFVWYQSRNGGQEFRGRPGTYDMNGYIQDFNTWKAVLPPLPLAGPALAAPSWMGQLPTFLSAETGSGGLGLVTYHRYPLRACVNNPANPIYASIANLLADNASAGLANSLVGYVSEAQAAGVPFRLDELNSASCRGRNGTSNTFASSLWVLDTLFDLAAVGVDGINLHTLPDAPYQPFSFTQSSSGAWSGTVAPVYYGMLMFADAAPPGSQLLAVSAPSGPLKVWATKAPDGHVRVVLINKSLTTDYTTTLQVPANSIGSMQTLSAPAFNARTGIQLGGQSFATPTTTGTLTGTPTSTPVVPVFGHYTVTVPAASAAMLTF